MTIARVTSLEQWEGLAAPWAEIARENPFASWEWLTTWWHHYGAGQQLCVLAVRDPSGNLIGAAPWYLACSAARGRVLKTLGSGEVCSDYLFVLCRAGHAAEVTRHLAAWLADGHAVGDGFEWDAISWECVPASDTIAAALVEECVAAGCHVQRQPAPSCWRIPLPATWPEYLASLSKSHRKQVQRGLRRLDDSRHAAWRVAVTQDELRRDMSILVDLHTRRWQSQGLAGVFGSSRFRRFLEEAVELLHKLGRVQVSVLELDGKPAASDLHFVTPSTSFAYQGGIEPALADESPGRILTGLLIRDAIRLGRTGFDFLRGDEPYKPHFRAVPDPTHHIQIVPPRAGAQIRHGIWLVGATVRQLVRSGISLTSGP
ncbi:MAG: GNAT family N-acetyltransferase [Pirellulaceae bacterium]